MTVNAESGKFHIRSFDALTTTDLYEILRARADVFTVEEKILYPDADGIDYQALHVFAMDEGNTVTSYLRMFPKEGEPDTVQIGRVLTRVHGQGEGAKLMAAGMKAAEKYLNAAEIYVESQKHAEGFYRRLGFETVSEEFIDAGIPHVEMRKVPGTGQERS